MKICFCSGPQLIIVVSVFLQRYLFWGRQKKPSCFCVSLSKIGYLNSSYLCILGPHQEHRLLSEVYFILIKYACHFFLLYCTRITSFIIFKDCVAVAFLLIVMPRLSVLLIIIFLTIVCVLIVDVFHPYMLSTNLVHNRQYFIVVIVL